MKVFIVKTGFLIVNNFVLCAKKVFDLLILSLFSRIASVKAKRMGIIYLFRKILSK